MTEQVCYATHPNHTRIHPDGTHYTAMGFVDMKYSFKNLFDTYYIPFTFKEFIGEKEVEEGKVEVSCQRHTVFGDHLENATLSSNFPISDVFTEITDANNNVVFRHVYRSPVFFCNKMKLGDILPLADMHANAGNHIRITCQLYNGEKLVAFDAAWKA